MYSTVGNESARPFFSNSFFPSIPHAMRMCSSDTVVVKYKQSSTMARNQSAIA